jgi:ribosomal protein S27AE
VTDTAPACCITEHCTRELRTWETDAHMLICSPCLSHMRTWLQQIPAAMTVLRDGSMQRERTGITGRSGTRTAPLPGRLDTLNLIGPAAHADIHDPHGDQIGERPLVGVLGDWVRLICEERRLNGPDQWAETALATWLTGQLGWASQQSWADELHAALRNMTWAIRGIARLDILTRPVSRPCPRCDMLSLTETDWDRYTRCGNCGTSYTQTELADDAQRRTAA